MLFLVGETLPQVRGTRDTDATHKGMLTTQLDGGGHSDSEELLLFYHLPKISANFINFTKNPRNAGVILPFFNF